MQIRNQLRLAMNGVVSSSMREKGVEYKLNFGVSVPKIKEIALRFEPDVELASLMWKEDVRELKILATLLFPVETFSVQQAESWVRMIRHQEVAEQFVANLLPKLPFARELALKWIEDKEEFVVVTGYLLFARLCTLGYKLTQTEVDSLLKAACKVLGEDASRRQRAAVLALKRYGRQSETQGQIVLNTIGAFATSGSPEKMEIYNDIKFEFDYYV